MNSLAPSVSRSSKTDLIIRRCCAALVCAVVLAEAGRAKAATLVNGDFEAPALLGPGQTAVSVNNLKLIQTDPFEPSYANAISGIAGWSYATPGTGGSSSDHGLARRNASFGLSSAGQGVFINNWNRMMSQTVVHPLFAGDTITATIDFGTLGLDTDAGRAGRFYLVAGSVNPQNFDQFSAGSIILDEISVANPTWTRFTPDVVVGNRQYVPLSLSYTYAANDPALNLPLTIAFRTETFSVGPTYWDNAVLTVPEPGSVALVGVGLLLFATRTPRDRRKGRGVPQRSSESR